ncbi:MAG: fibrobacter succinogenes major paralogous domain-containing protein [Odoribacter sp.]|nr:fibrobacter succinogenes major paralogous domain-containing protein [Odoribacter sp.]
MRKIQYVCCLIGVFFTLWACQDDEPAVTPKPEGIIYGIVMDKAGNVYKTLTIGRQTWLAENFRYRLEDGDATAQVTYGESYSQANKAVLEGNDMNAYRSFCGNWYGQEFLLYLREQLFAAYEEGRLVTAASTLSGRVSSFSIPYLLDNNQYTVDKDELLLIWDDAVNHYLKVDKAYLEQYGYLYSHEGALRAVQEGAPEGYHLPTDAEWMMLERQLGMNPEELEGLENWRGTVGDLLKPGEQGIGFDALYGGAAVYALSMQNNSRYVNKGEGAYFWSSDEVVVSDSLSNGIVRNLSCYHAGIRRMTTRLVNTEGTIRPSYSVRLVKVEN